MATFILDVFIQSQNCFRDLIDSRSWRPSYFLMRLEPWSLLMHHDGHIWDVAGSVRPHLIIMFHLGIDVVLYIVVLAIVAVVIVDVNLLSLPSSLEFDIVYTLLQRLWSLVELKDWVDRDISCFVGFPNNLVFRLWYWYPKWNI